MVVGAWHKDDCEYKKTFITCLGKIYLHEFNTECFWKISVKYFIIISHFDQYDCSLYRIRWGYKLIVHTELVLPVSSTLLKSDEALCLQMDSVASVFQMVFLAVLNRLQLATRKYRWLIQLQNELTWLTHRPDGAIQSDWAVGKKLLHKTDSVLRYLLCTVYRTVLIMSWCSLILPNVPLILFNFMSCQRVRVEKSGF